MIRFVLLFPLLYSLFYKQKIPSLFLYVLLSLTDVFDGYFARKFKQVTEIGKIIDPIVDKLTLISIGILLWYQQRIASYFVWAVVIRETLIIIGSLIIISKKKKIVVSNLFGKLFGFVVFFLILSIILELNQISLYLTYLALGVLIISTVSYTTVFFKFTKD